jgi:thiamine transport system substrate-binding protein
MSLPSIRKQLPARATTLVAGLVAVTVGAAVLTGCGGTASQPSEQSASQSVTVRLLTHDSFALSDELFTQFTAATGITVEVIAVGDAGALVNSAVLAAGNPEGDVLFGVDTTFLSRAVSAGVFEEYVSAEAGALRPELVDLAATAGAGSVTPIDDGDVCINVDDTWFAERGVEPPDSLADLVDPRYRDLLVVQNPATSSPGLAFLLATIAMYGDDWPEFWSELRDNGVLVVDGWTESYVGAFTGGGEGDRPIVVSYSTSPPAEIVYAASPAPTRPSTSVLLDGCYRQVEFAGVLRGTQQPAAARAVIDWLISPEVQADIPLSMFVFPARADTALPQVFTDFVTRPNRPLELDSATIEANRATWIEQWTALMQ